MNKPVLEINKKELKIKNKKIFASKETADYLAQIISEKITSLDGKVPDNIIKSLELFNPKKHPYFVYHLISDKGEAENNVGKMLTEKKSDFWGRGGYNLQISEKFENGDFFIAVSPGRNPSQYTSLMLVLFDIAGELELDLNIVLKTMDTEFKFETKPNDNSLQKLFSFDDFIPTKKASRIPDDLKSKRKNISFKLGQPNTGKSHSFKESVLFDGFESNEYVYSKIMVEGGKGSQETLTSSDISISMNPATNESFITPFLKVVMSAIINKDTPHVIFLDDFHNVNISTLLSPYMGMLKKFQKVEDLSNVDFSDFDNIEELTETWNENMSQIEKNNDIELFEIMNKMNGQTLKLFAPKNLYILGAANWNNETKNMFADIRERARIESVKSKANSSFEFDDKNLNVKETYQDFIYFLNYSIRLALKDNRLFKAEDKFFIGEHRVTKLFEYPDVNNYDIKEDIQGAFDLIADSCRGIKKATEVFDIGFLIVKYLVQNDDAKNFLSRIFDMDEDLFEVFENDSLYETNSQNEAFEVLSELFINE